MPKAEVGSTKWLGNKMKAKGLQRLRWYCQACERQMRDANGFKQHTMSEAHVRQMQIVGQDANKYINNYSQQFKSDFLLLLRTSHGEKKVNANHFYNEYIANKEHIHMNATKWPNLTEFVKFLGREGICRVEEGDRGIEISWIDNSPEALRRQTAIQKKERQDKGDEEREHRLIQAQIERANRDAASKTSGENERESAATELQRDGNGKITLSFAPKLSANDAPMMPPSGDVTATTDAKEAALLTREEPGSAAWKTTTAAAPKPISQPAIDPPKFSFSSASKAKNVFASASKKNAFSPAKPATKGKSDKPMSEAERIMKEELDRKRRRGDREGPDAQRKRLRM